MDEGAFVFDYVTPTGTELDETDRQLAIVEGIMLSTPEVAAIARRTGAEMGMFATEQNSGTSSCGCDPRVSARARSSP
jgi:multidrug efflux pump subunit AcrB